MCTSTLGVGQDRTAELPRRFEGKGLSGEGWGKGAPFKMVWALPTPAKEPWALRGKKALLLMGGANTAGWREGLCTNKWKVNSSWWTQKPTYKSHKKSLHIVLQCASLPPTIYVWRGNRAKVKTMWTMPPHLSTFMSSSSVLVYSEHHMAVADRLSHRSPFWGPQQKGNSYIVSRGYTLLIFLMFHPICWIQGASGTLPKSDVKHRISKTSHRVTWSHSYP